MPRATASAPTPAPPRRARRKEARPGELLDAALTLFVEKGYAATRVEEVASLAGVSKGTLFLYFPSKEDLFKAVVRENLAGRFPEWSAELAQFEGDSAALVRYAMQTWWERVGMTPASGITKLVMSEASTFPEIASFYQQEVIRPGHELLRRILQRGIHRGELRADLPLDYAVYGFIAPMIFLLTWKHSMAPCVPADQQLNPQRWLDTQVELILHGLMRRAP